VRKSAKPKKPISEKQRASDEKLREQLRNFDLKVFDKALGKAIKPSSSAPRRPKS
jgi:hypothetical protein